MPARTPAAVLAVAALLLSISPVAAAPILDVTAYAPEPSGPPLGEWQAVAAINVVVVPDGAEDTVGARFFQVNDDSANWAYVEEVHIAIDVDGDRAWNPDVDQFYPDLPPATRVWTNWGTVSTVVEDDDGFEANRAAWYGQPVDVPLLHFTTGPVDLLVLYRFAPDVPLDAVFAPYFEKTFLGWSTIDKWDGFDSGNLSQFLPWVFTGVGSVAHPIGGVVVGDDTDVPMAAFDLIALPDGPYELLAIELDLTSGNPEDLLTVRLVHDANANRQADPGEMVLADAPAGDVQAWPVTLAIDKPTTLKAGDTLPLVAVADFDAEVKSGMAYGLAVTGGFTDLYDLGGLPISSGVVTGMPVQQPGLKLMLAPMLADGETLTPGTTGAAIALLQIDATDISAMVQGLTLDITAGVFDSVTVVRDANGNGQLDAADAELQTVTPADPGAGAMVTATFDTGNATVTAGGRLQFLVVVDVAVAVKTGLASIEMTGVSTDAAVPVQGVDGATVALTIGNEDNDSDPEFDPLVTIEPVNSGTAGCQAGTSGGAWVLAALLAVAAAVRRQR